MRAVKTLTFATIFFVTFLFGISISCGGKNKQCDKWIKTFFKMPLKEQIDKFGSYTLDEQYSIYICGNEVVHPPAMYLATSFARNGKAVVKLLKIKLSETIDDLTIRDIVLVFSEMKKQKTYNVLEDSALMKLLRNKVATMQNEDWRKIVEEMMNEIEEKKS